jgi:hypothetical protein
VVRAPFFVYDTTHCINCRESPGLGSVLSRRSAALIEAGRKTTTVVSRRFGAFIQERVRHVYRRQQPYLSVSNVWSTWLRLSGDKCDPLRAAINRKASSRSLTLVSYERHTRISNARFGSMP